MGEKIDSWDWVWTKYELSRSCSMLFFKAGIHMVLGSSLAPSRESSPWRNWLSQGCGAIDRLYYWSSLNIVFTVDNVKPYHTKHLFQNGRLLLMCIVLQSPTIGNPDVCSYTHSPVPLPHQHIIVAPSSNRHFKTVSVFFAPVCIPPVFVLLCCCWSAAPATVSPWSAPRFHIIFAKIRQVSTSFVSSFASFLVCLL
jgi:hypothetical protein